MQIPLIPAPTMQTLKSMMVGARPATRFQLSQLAAVAPSDGPSRNFLLGFSADCSTQAGVFT